MEAAAEAINIVVLMYLVMTSRSLRPRSRAATDGGDGFAEASLFFQEPCWS